MFRKLRRHVSYLLVVVVLLTVWLAAGKIVSDSNLSWDRSPEGLKPAFNLQKNYPGPQASKPNDSLDNSKEDRKLCASLLQKIPEADKTEAGILEAAGFNLPEEALPQGAAQKPLSLDTEPFLPVSMCMEEAEPVSPAPRQVSADTLSSPAAQEALPPYSLGKSYCRQFRIRVNIKNVGDTESQNIRLQIPVISSLNSPYQVVKSETFSQEPVEVTQGDFNSRIAHFLISRLSPGKTASINITYKLIVYPITANFSAFNGAAGIPVTETSFLQPAPNIESNHPEIVAKAEEVISGAGDDLEKARAIYQFVQRHMRYNPNSACRNQGALTALREKVGVCEDYAALFVALCRAADIPARQVNGYADPKGTGQCWNELAQAFPLRGYRHSWAEFYLPGAGWLPADPTMNISTQDLKYFGCLPYCSHIAQNHYDQSVRIKFQGGRLEATWEEELI